MFCQDIDKKNNTKEGRCGSRKKKFGHSSPLIKTFVLSAKGGSNSVGKNDFSPSLNNLGSKV